MATSKRVYAKRNIPNHCCQYSHPCGEPLLTQASTGDPPTPASRFGSVSCGGHCSFPLGLGAHKILFMSSKTRVSVIPNSGEVLYSNSIGLQDLIPWGFPVPLSDPQAGKPDVGFKMVTTVQELLWYYYSLICGCPPGGYRIWFYCDCTPPNVSLRLLLCLGMWSTFFLVGSSVLLLMAVQQLVAVLVLL